MRGRCQCTAQSVGEGVRVLQNLRAAMAQDARRPQIAPGTVAVGFLRAGTGPDLVRDMISHMMRENRAGSRPLRRHIVMNA